MVILAQRWAEKYMGAHAEAVIQVTGGGSGVGIAALINGTTDIATASRQMKQDEKLKLRDRYQTMGVEIPVAKDGLSVYLNEKNPVQELTFDQLEAIYTGKITNWKEVGGPDARITLYSRENSSGTYAFFKEVVLGGADYRPATARRFPGTAAVVNAVAQDENGIGYGGAAYAKGIRDCAVRSGRAEPGRAPERRDGQGRHLSAQPRTSSSTCARSRTATSRSSSTGCSRPRARALVDRGRVLPALAVVDLGGDSCSGIDRTASRPAGVRYPAGPPSRSRVGIRERSSSPVLRLCAILAVVGLGLIILFVFREALPILFDPAIQQGGEPAGLLLDADLAAGERRARSTDCSPARSGTLKVTLVAMVFATPLGVLAAIYTSEFAPPRVREIIKPAVELLAGIPSVVLGFFALVVLATWLHDADRTWAPD